MNCIHDDLNIHARLSWLDLFFGLFPTTKAAREGGWCSDYGYHGDLAGNPALLSAVGSNEVALSRLSKREMFPWKQNQQNDFLVTVRDLNLLLSELYCILLLGYVYSPYRR